MALIASKPRYRTIIAGSRSIEGRAAFLFLCRAIDDLPWRICEVVSGHAHGVDRMGENWAHRRDVMVRLFPALWEQHGKSAGFKRNVEMAQHAEALLAIWDGKSPGTAHMIRTAWKYGLHVVERTFLGDGLDF